jgi:GDPmannose 4,6-dehydratase
LLGDPSKARTRLGWRHTVGFKDLVTEMVDSDLQVVLREATRNDRHG